VCFPGGEQAHGISPVDFRPEERAAPRS
jgi:hypothetical protein